VTAVEIDGPRLLARLDELAAGAPSASGRGVTRLAWSPEDVAARQTVAAWATEAGATCRLDPAANLIMEVPGADPALPPLVLGSHLDSVVEAGALDGAYGVVAAVEVLAALHAAGLRLRHTVRAVAFANEEGVVGAAFAGSLAIAGRAAAVDLSRAGPDGSPLTDRLRQAGGDPDRLADAAWGPIAGYLELHIEQGPVLEAEGVRIGIVTGITGRFSAEIVIEGRANHAGTTPMGLRCDAALAVAQATLAVHALADPGPADVATVGRLTTEPGNSNVVAGRATASVDVRALDDARRDAARDQLLAELAGIAARSGTEIALSPRGCFDAVLTDPNIRAAISAAAGPLAVRELPSGAGHDAQHMAALGPIGMIFVPTIGGISHNPLEATAPDDLVLGAHVLAESLIGLDRG
jgi:hydantoinase/carbamoylase family amidase